MAGNDYLFARKGIAVKNGFPNATSVIMIYGVNSIVKNHHGTTQEQILGKKDGKPDKSVILYNPHLTLRDIPLEAYDYVVNGKSAIEWVMERYAVSVDKSSGIKNDPNEWSTDPRYIVDLVKRIVRVSVETARIVKGLPALAEMS